jgi:mono/diheme cytochrome c family protein
MSLRPKNFCLLIAFLTLTTQVLAVPKPRPASVVGDPAATDFTMKCAGCHTIGGGKLTGPDLKDASAWKLPDLATKIKTMEKKVGPLTPEEIQALGQFLKDPKVHDRLAAEQERIALAEEAKYEKGDPKKGTDLFFGRVSLEHGGLACAACHRVGARGAGMGPDLAPVFDKMGTTPLISACEKTPFRLMDAAYREHPVTHQEAIHLAKYLESVKGAETPEQDPVALLGGAAGLGLFGLGGISVYYRKKPRRLPPSR